MTRKVEVYWNSKVKAFSVREKPFGKPIVVGHAKRLLLREVTFSVGHAGRIKFLETGHKNVHAFMRGELHAVEWVETFVFGLSYEDNWTRGDDAYATVARKRLGVTVRYNPRDNISFVDIEPNGKASQCRGESEMAYLRVFDRGKPEILAFNPLLMTQEESRAATA
jgi:hypothetical protein